MAMRAGGKSIQSAGGVQTGEGGNFSKQVA